MQQPGPQCPPAVLRLPSPPNQVYSTAEGAPYVLKRQDQKSIVSHFRCREACRSLAVVLRGPGPMHVCCVVLQEPSEAMWHALSSRKHAPSLHGPSDHYCMVVFERLHQNKLKTVNNNFKYPAPKQPTVQALRERRAPSTVGRQGLRYGPPPGTLCVATCTSHATSGLISETSATTQTMCMFYIHVAGNKRTHRRR